MSAARPRSREVKLIFFIASTIGRASKLVMSTCSTTVESSSALRVSLIGDWSFMVSLPRIEKGDAGLSPRREWVPCWPKPLQLDDAARHRRGFRNRGVEADHRLVV